MKKKLSLTILISLVQIGLNFLQYKTEFICSNWLTKYKGKKGR